MSSSRHDVSFARGAYTMLGVWAAFSLVGPLEAGLLVALDLAGLGPIARTAAAAALGIGARAILVLHTVRARPSDPDRLEAWKPIALTVAAAIATLAGHALRLVAGWLQARERVTDPIADEMVQAAVVWQAVSFVDLAVVLVALWIAFARGRDRPPPDPLGS